MRKSFGFFLEILTDVFSVVGTVFVICYSVPLVIVVVIPLFCVFFFIQRAYIRVSRQLTRMVSTSRSPINSSLTETYNGAATIRAFRSEENFIEENDNRIETSQQFYYPEIVSNSWLLIRLQLISIMVQFSFYEFKIFFEGFEFVWSFGVIDFSWSYLPHCFRWYFENPWIRGWLGSAWLTFLHFNWTFFYLQGNSIIFYQNFHFYTFF